MEGAFGYRFRPTGAQAAGLSRTFGCVRLVHIKASAARTEAWYRRRDSTGAFPGGAVGAGAGRPRGGPRRGAGPGPPVGGCGIPAVHGRQEAGATWCRMRRRCRSAKGTKGTTSRFRVPGAARPG
ncbi:helix-turn-helix domain-containing protein [Nocardiopsis dassonvillei]|uniref:helix-turn-helix domain-containing protein n=1 Tax=Nocardiopsis dassonvillei TaxID=2014 RepID=UPI003F549B65